MILVLLLAAWAPGLSPACPAGQQRCRDFPCGSECTCDGPPTGFGLCVPKTITETEKLVCISGQQRCRDFPCGSECKCDGPPTGFGFCVPNIEVGNAAATEVGTHDA